MLLPLDCPRCTAPPSIWIYPSFPVLWGVKAMQPQVCNTSTLSRYFGNFEAGFSNKVPIYFLSLLDSTLNTSDLHSTAVHINARPLNNYQFYTTWLLTQNSAAIWKHQNIMALILPFVYKPMCPRLWHR